MSMYSGIKNSLASFSKKEGSSLTVLAIVLFLLFDFIALSLNVWLSYRIEQQAININLSGRQRMLSQRMVKTLLLMDKNIQNEQVYLEYLEELSSTFDRFEYTLDAFHRGGRTFSAESDMIEVAPLTSEATREIINQALREWAPLRQKVRQLIGREFDTLLLQQANDVAQRKNLALLALMNALTVELEHETQEEAQRIRFFQGIAFLLALVNFSVAIILYRLRVRKAHHTLDLVDNIMNRIATGIIVVDASGSIVRANKVMAEMSGFSQQELLNKKKSVLLVDYEGKTYGLRKYGERYHCKLEVSKVTLNNKPATVYTVIDDSVSVAQQQELAQLAYHDQLTDLPNRHLFKDRLDLELKHASRRGEKLAVLFIDLNGFKSVNDQYGHKFGDLLLGRVAVRMRDTVRESDTVARIGGDEFTLILTDVANYQQCKALVEKILAAICKPYLIQDIVVDVGASIGVACFPDDAQEEADLLSLADKAMYQSKASGESRITFASAWRSPDD